MAFTPSFEQAIQNNPNSDLDGAINDSVTSLDVLDASGFPSSGNFRIMVNNEIMLVTGVSSNTFTVVRGAEGSTAASHSSGVTAYQRVTVGGYQQYMMDRFPFWGEKPRLHWLGDTSDNELTSTSFTWLNQGGATVSDFDMGGFAIVTPRSAGESLRVLHRSAPSTPFSVTACVGHSVVAPYAGASDFARIGIGFYESGTGKLMGIAANGNGELAVLSYTDTTTLAGTDFDQPVPVNSAQLWLKIEDDGSDLTFSFSNSGVGTFTEVHTEGRSAHFTTAPDSVMVFTNGRWGATGSGDSHVGTLQYWREE